MKPHKSPCSISKVVKISKTSSNREEREYKNEEIQGGICKDTRYAWISWGPFFKVIEVATGEKIAEWRFGASHLEFCTKVLCVAELPSCDGSPSVSQFVVGLECEVIEGMVCIFNVQGSRLLRAIRIPGKVVSLSVVDGGTGGCEGRYPLPGLLSSMSGIVAVGLDGGEVLLLDLCRTTCDELVNTWFSDDRETLRDEFYPCHLVPISRNDNESEKLEVVRTDAAQTGNHLSLLLNESSFVLENFLLLGPDGEVRVHFQKSRVAVTSLLYIPRIASIVIGFNFSCFQIWNLMHLNLNFTSTIMDDPLPVVHLGFQEPSDDPRNFCYVWAVHSSTDMYVSSSTPLGIMYALCYESKEWVDGYGYLYQDFLSCSLRFEYDLVVNCADIVANSRSISFHTLSNASPAQRNLLEVDYDEAGLENKLSLSAFVWENYESSGKPNSTYLSLFDLDQWYKDQMPNTVSDTDDDPAPCYLAMFSLSDIRENHPEANHLLDVRIDSKTLSQFKSFQSLEEHFHPTALSFVSRCLLSSKIVFVDHPGLQKHVLLHMEKEGPLSILHPTRMLKHCINIGLKPILCEVINVADFSVSEQREFLLSVALENQMLSFLFRCGTEWGSGAQSIAGCTLHVLLKWAWQRATILKEQADAICVPLFNHSSERLDKNECRQLDKCANQLYHLATLFKSIMNDYRIPKIHIQKDLNQKANALQLAALYFEVVQWFLNVGLLPEFPETENSQEDIWLQKIPYPATKLNRIYQERRKELVDVHMKSYSKLNLFIDEMIDHESGADQLIALWKQDGGSGTFPPPSLQSLLGTYLVDGIDTRIKHSIVIYVFLDLAALLDSNIYGKAIDYFIKFPSAFCMSPSIIKVTQAFWLLDHKNFEEAFDMVLDPLVAPSDLKPWQHCYIVQAFLLQGHENKALDYFSVRKLPVSNLEDIRLKITLLVVNSQITQAYHFLRQHRNENNCSVLLEHFFRECKKMNQLGVIMKLFLTPLEEEAFMNFLETCKHPRAEDMRVVYYLMRSRIVEAIDTNEKIHCYNTHKRIHCQQSVRDILVDGYAKTLPNVTRQLAQYCAQEKKAFINWRQVERPTPLSVDIHHGISKPVRYKSSLIHATLEKARETWLGDLTPKEKDISDVSTMKNMPFLCIPQDGLRHDREITPVVFPTLTCQSVKRFLDEPDDTPSKRSRHENYLPSPNNAEQKQIECYSTGGDASLLLQSPHVTRVQPRKSLAGENNATSGSVGDGFTPQSILKVRNIVCQSPVPDEVFRSSSASGNATTPELLEEKEEEERAVTMARQIRFSLPPVGETDECNLHTPARISTVERISHRASIIGVTPRQALHLPSTESAVQFSLSTAESKQSLVKQEEGALASSLKRKAIRSSVDLDTVTQSLPHNVSSKLLSTHVKELLLTTSVISSDDNNKSVEDKVSDCVEDDSFYSVNTSEVSLNSETSKEKDEVYDKNTCEASLNSETSKEKDEVHDKNASYMESTCKRPRVRSPIHEMKDKNRIQLLMTQTKRNSSNLVTSVHRNGHSDSFFLSDASALVKEEFAKSETVHNLKSKEEVQMDEDGDSVSESNDWSDVLVYNTSIELSDESVQEDENEIEVKEKGKEIEELPQFECIKDDEKEETSDENKHSGIVFDNEVNLEKSEGNVSVKDVHAVRAIVEEKHKNINDTVNEQSSVLQADDILTDNTDISITDISVDVQDHAGVVRLDFSCEDNDICVIEPAAENVQVELSTHEEKKTYEILLPVQVEEFSEDIVMLATGDNFDEANDPSIVIDVTQQLPDLLSKMEEQNGLQNVVDQNNRNYVNSVMPVIHGPGELPDVLVRTVEVSSDQSAKSSFHSIEEEEEEEANMKELKQELYTRQGRYEEEAIGKVNTAKDMKVEDSVVKVNKSEEQSNGANDPLLSRVNMKLTYDKLENNDDIIILDSDSDLEDEVENSNEEFVNGTLNIRKDTYCETSEDDVSNDPLITVHDIESENTSIASNSASSEDSIAGQKYDEEQLESKNEAVILERDVNKDVLQLGEHTEMSTNAELGQYSDVDIKENTLDIDLPEIGIRDTGPVLHVTEMLEVSEAMDNLVDAKGVEVNVEEVDENLISIENTITTVDLNNTLVKEEGGDNLKHSPRSNQILVSNVIESVQTVQETAFRTSCVQRKQHKVPDEDGEQSENLITKEFGTSIVHGEPPKCVSVVQEMVESEIMIKETDCSQASVQSEHCQHFGVQVEVAKIEFETTKCDSTLSFIHPDSLIVSEEEEDKQIKHKDADSMSNTVQSKPRNILNIDEEIVHRKMNTDKTNSVQKEHDITCFVKDLKTRRVSRRSSVQNKFPTIPNVEENILYKEVNVRKIASRTSSVQSEPPNISDVTGGKSRHKKERTKRAQSITASIQSEPPVLFDVDVTDEVFKHYSSNSSQCPVASISNSSSKKSPTKQHGSSEDIVLQSKEKQISNDTEVSEIKDFLSEIIEQACSRDISTEGDIVVVGQPESKHFVGEQLNISSNNGLHSKDNISVQQTEAVQSTSLGLIYRVKDVSKIVGNDEDSVCSIKLYPSTHQSKSAKNTKIKEFSAEILTSLVSSDATDFHITVNEEPKYNEACVHHTVVTRSSKRAHSLSSQSSSVIGDPEERPVVKSEFGSTCKSSVSDSSKSTLIFGETVSDDNARELHLNLRSKRKRQSSMSSHISSVLTDTTNDDCKLKSQRRSMKIIRQCKISDAESEEDSHPKKSVEQSQQEVMEEYATARRLTRHQRSLLERSLEVSKVTQESRRHRRLRDNVVESDDESSETSSVATRSSVTRHSLRLQEHKEGSAINGHSTEGLQMAPLKKAVLIHRTRRSLDKSLQSQVDHKSSSPASIKSEVSTRYASSVTSTQSHLLHSPGSSQSEGIYRHRRKSFQRAQLALTESPAKARSLPSKVSSELESIEPDSVDEEISQASRLYRRRSVRLNLNQDTNYPVQSSLTELKTQSHDEAGDSDDTSEVGSVISQSSTVSAGGGRITRFSLRNRKLDLLEVKKSPVHTQVKMKVEENQSSFCFSPPTAVLKEFGSVIDVRPDPVPTFMFSLPQTRSQISQNKSRSYVAIHQVAPSLQTIEEEPSSSSSIPSSVTEKKKSRRTKSRLSPTGTSSKRRSRAFNFFSPMLDNDNPTAARTSTETKGVDAQQSKKVVYSSIKTRKSFKLRRKSGK